MTVVEGRPIALRIASDKWAWISFYVRSIPFVMAAVALVWVLLFAMKKLVQEQLGK